ncbi:MAG: tRNA 2-thiouridine(34) synthase MnmA [Phycisphaerae bacterium]|nr:tRNA 2-thiouridine(34) synthase MnmA [Phycisphaerae bacterium]
MSGQKVIVATSGGVDSAVAAALLKQQGADVVGVFLCLGRLAQADAVSRACCSADDAADARRVADTLGIDLHVIDAGAAFEGIINEFAAEYACGRTPNPCIRCNAEVKFARLLKLADALGARYVASGHHARVLARSGRGAIARGKAAGKDQSYALFGLSTDWLQRIVLPIGELDDKDTVRRIARELGLVVHDKPDSQEVCFVEGDDYSPILAARAPQALRPGPIVNAGGEVLGRHDGYGRFTLGQRRGLGVAAGAPMYVTAIDPATATVTLGPREDLLRRSLSASRASWQQPVGERFRAAVQIRYTHRATAATVRRTVPDRFEVDFDSPVSAVTPGQAAVVYDGDVVLGGGWID